MPHPQSITRKYSPPPGVICSAAWLPYGIKVRNFQKEEYVSWTDYKIAHSNKYRVHPGKFGTNTYGPFNGENKVLGRPLIRPAIFECMSLGLVTPDTSLRKSEMLGWSDSIFTGEIEFPNWVLSTPPAERWVDRGEGGTWLIFCWVCASGFSEPLLHYSLFCDQL